MDDLQKRFGRLVAAHRRRMGWTQAKLSEETEISLDMITRIGDDMWRSFSTIFTNQVVA